jgi:hypothetical protein
MTVVNVRRHLFALGGVAALVGACNGGADPIATPVITGSMLAEIAGHPNPSWNAGREANAAVDGDAIRIVGEDSLGRKITIRLYGIDLGLSQPSTQRDFEVTSTSLFTTGFAQLYETNTGAAHSTGAQGGSGLIRITLATPTRIAGTFTFTGRLQTSSSLPSSEFRLVRQGAFDVGFK